MDGRALRLTEEDCVYKKVKIDEIDTWSQLSRLQAWRLAQHHWIVTEKITDNWQGKQCDFGVWA